MQGKKAKIERQSIKSNIYDKIQLIIDYTGLTDDDIMSETTEIDVILSGRNLRKEVSALNINEINEYSARKEIELSLAAKKMMTDRENSLRYISEETGIEILIYRTFCIITMNYSQEIKHSLNENFKIVASIMENFKQREFFKIEAVAIKKINRIYCSSLYQLYRCFERKIMGDSSWGIDGKDVMLDVVQSKTSFSKGQIRYEVEKILESGYDVETADEIYSGKLTLTGNYRPSILEEIDVEEKFKLINGEMFNIFLTHMTVGFLEDMQKGMSNKVIGGLNCNE